MRTKAWILGLLPALVMTTSVLTSTLTQSVVTYPTRLEPVLGLTNANVLRATEFFSTSANMFWEVMLNGTYNEYGGGDALAEPATRFAHLFQTAENDKTLKLLNDAEDPIMGVVANVSRNIAASLSKGIATNNEYRETYATDNKVKGENLGPVTFINVRWPWLLLLGSQILMSMIFVTIIIMRTALSNLGVTKSSLLPVLFAINSEDRALVEDSTEDKYNEEFKKIADGATGVVGKFSTGLTRRGWVLKGPNDEI
ncbi:hypothetical protein CEP54_009451 [Fusarium duplospermum]|uniref:Uncharacterized protein n=1 Tax=Fusarium duplospermum TaxID=1325734 RepID=A0A428PQA0_9HYPO|nr:hypothetical protein CEP54_009451 [Fusarium duplospermum]